MRPQDYFILTIFLSTFAGIFGFFLGRAVENIVETRKLRIRTVILEMLTRIK